MKEFFKVTDLSEVIRHAALFPRVATEHVPLDHTTDRILAEDIVSDIDLPDFSKSIMDGYAVRASSTFGATESNPAYLDMIGAIAMGETPDVSIERGQAVRISTGGMLPDGADSVVMIEHSEILDDTSIEVYRSVAPGQHILEQGEDIKHGVSLLSKGQRIRPQETGLLAALGRRTVCVYKKPVIGIISTGDEVVPVDAQPALGQIRDVNTHTLSGLVSKTGAIPLTFGIVKDNVDDLFETCKLAHAQSDMVLISGGSSVGTRDFTIDALSAMSDSRILVHGISISPGKPTILAKSQRKAVWGLPGHVVSAMIVYHIVVKPFIEHISGFRAANSKRIKLPATLNRNISSAQGRTDFIRVRLIEKNGNLFAEPILGKSGLIFTMLQADGIIEIGINTEGLGKGTKVDVMLL
jgi:molybdopterin molybdotransferase